MPGSSFVSATTPHREHGRIGAPKCPSSARAATRVAGWTLRLALGAAVAANSTHSPYKSSHVLFQPSLVAHSTTFTSCESHVSCDTFTSKDKSAKSHTRRNSNKRNGGGI